jgi:sec-independent protein translocase protein TatB
MNFLSNFNGIELLFILILGLLLFGPDKLPEIAARVGKYVRILREMASDAMAQIQEETGISQETIDSANTLRTAFNDVQKSTAPLKDTLKEQIQVQSQAEPSPRPIPGPKAEKTPPPREDLQKRVQELESMIQKLKSELADQDRGEEG